MLRADIDLIAWTDRAMPKNASIADMLYYHAINDIYNRAKADEVGMDNAKRLKADIAGYLDMLNSLAHSNSKIIIELSKLTAPRRELPKKSKAELLEIINRIEAIVTGLMKEYDGKLPEFMKIKEDKNESV